MESLIPCSRAHRELRRRLTPKRYHHSVAVACRAGELAQIHGVDWFTAAWAGLLHDICHCDPPDRQLKYMESHGILVDNFTLLQPQLWHAPAGALLLEELGITHRGILCAVRYHTTGRADMTALEKVVYLADATSRDRVYPGVGDLAALADKDLDAAMATSLTHTMEMLRTTGLPVVEDARRAFACYCGNQADKNFVESD